MPLLHRRETQKRRKFKKRHAIGERAPYILMFILLFNVSTAAVNTLHLFSYSAIPNASFNVGPVQTQGECQTFTVGQDSSQCNPSIGNTASVIPSLLVFGDWFGGMVSVIIAFAQGLVVPGYFLFQFGVPAVWVAIFSAGIYACWFFLLIWLRTGRPL
jgi:hypothetical protein